MKVDSQITVEVGWPIDYPRSGLATASIKPARVASNSREDPHRDETALDDFGNSISSSDRRATGDGPVDLERSGGMDQATPAFRVPDGCRRPGLYRAVAAQDR